MPPERAQRLFEILAESFVLSRRLVQTLLAFWDFAGYLQDSIGLSERLSLHAGLRYEAALMPQPPAPNPVLPFT